eukprot:TRINITY_DN4804_c0_g1_i2.p1 TRINITY_DN4804_c0_g1~~TRINITY_DN4804_c0_g1_i2.p1  ORF type:complete len:177 (-),score=21.35 TRINITY_DN4804_c0_g1_i2:75-542(-)
MNGTMNDTTIAYTMDTLPLFNDALWYTTLLSTLASLLAVGGSIGGGGMQVCLFLALFNFGASAATALSRTIVFAVSVVSYFFAFRERVPSGKKPLIDYDVALLMGPMSVLGSIFGVMVNAVVSDYIVFICMVAVLGFSFVKTLQKGLEIRKKELG